MDGEREKYDGYLYKIEQSMVGQSRKKYWFVLPFDSPILYWFKNASDFQCSGRISLSGAAFTYNPREQGLFEIHVNNEVIHLEAPNNQLRTEWLRMLQTSRKRYYQRNFSLADDADDGNSPNLSSDVCPSTSANINNNESNEVEDNGNDDDEVDDSDAVFTATDGEDEPSAVWPTMRPVASQSTFYLSERGELNRHSLCLPDEPTTGPTAAAVYAPAAALVDVLLTRAGAEAQALEQSLRDSPTRRIINRARESMRRLSETKGAAHSSNAPAFGGKSEMEKECKSERYVENLEITSQLRNRCFELTDELVANQELIAALKRSLITAHNQRDALAKICEESATVENKLDVVLERESLLTGLQCTVTDLRRKLEYYKEENRSLESENSSLNATIDAFRESIRTKDELILKYYDNPQAGGGVVDAANAVQLGSGGRSSSLAQEVPEAILFDVGAVDIDPDAKRLFTEASVNDVTEMKDLVDGYASQNKFLNNEVIELQRIVQSLEERERKLIRQNFDIEAIYYQLKSRYIMVLNHFRLSTHSNRFLDPTLIHNLIDEMARPPSAAIRVDSPTTAGTHANSGGSSVIDPKSYSMLLSPYKNNLHYLSAPFSDMETDALGFYLNSPRSRCQTPMAMMAITRLTASVAGCTSQISAVNGDVADSVASHPVEPTDAFTAYRSVSPASEEGTSEPGPSLIASTASKLPASVATGSAGEVAVPSSSASLGMLAGRSLPDPSSTDDWMVRVAAHLKKRSDDIRDNIALANNRDYIDWLQKWDAFLVNHVLQPLPDPGLNSELKSLIRMGVSHAYRSRIWKSLVFHYVGSTEAEMGKGYYACLLRKAELIHAKGTDSALKQIDLDLGRTLPTNKQFDSENSAKTQSLKRVLYAFRFHNRAVEYCQGLNRIAAIGLLYLNEEDAFWFLVACVEYLQPPNYYSHNLLGAVIDQKILLDLMQKKLPALWEHFRRLDVDLSLFTLNWFLTIFVDALTHNIYINIFDVFLYEGNKVLFRFALALLKLCEQRILECSSLTGVQACISNLSGLTIDYKTLAIIAFKQLNPFPSKMIESRRQTYTAQLKSSDR